MRFFKNILSNTWNSLYSNSRNAIVFEKRNKDYGAYLLRKSYFKTILRSYLAAIIIVLILIFTPALIDVINQIIVMNQPAEKTNIEIQDVPEIMLSPPPQIIPDPVKPQGIPAFIIKQNDKDSIIYQTKKENKDSSKQQTADKPDSLFIAKQDSSLQDSLDRQMEDSSSLVEKNNSSSNMKKNNGLLTMKVDSLPEFPGGEKEMNKFLDEHTKYTIEAMAKNRSGTVYVSFVVMEDGGIGSIKLVAGLGNGLDDMVINTIKSMPKWKPGIRQGKPQRFLVSLPVSFYLK